MSKLDLNELEVLQAYDAGKLKPSAGKAEFQRLRAAACLRLTCSISRRRPSKKVCRTKPSSQASCTSTSLASWLKAGHPPLARSDASPLADEPRRVLRRLVGVSGQLSEAGCSVSCR
jgi:hypothetical protein